MLGLDEESLSSISSTHLGVPSLYPVGLGNSSLSMRDCPQVGLIMALPADLGVSAGIGLMGGASTKCSSSSWDGKRRTCVPVGGDG